MIVRLDPWYIQNLGKWFWRLHIYSSLYDFRSVVYFENPDTLCDFVVSEFTFIHEVYPDLHLQASDLENVRSSLAERLLAIGFGVDQSYEEPTANFSVMPAREDIAYTARNGYIYELHNLLQPIIVIREDLP